jgi:predicted HicB family RNase H-like nuclease
MMEHKGYTGIITEIDQKSGLIHGEVVGITDMITFQGKSTHELLRAFRESVDDYLEYCASRNESPEKPYSGKFVVRISPALHCRAANAAQSCGQSLNFWVKASLERSLSGNDTGSLEPGMIRGNGNRIFSVPPEKNALRRKPKRRIRRSSK